MQKVNIRLNDGTKRKANCAATFSEAVGPYIFNFAVTRAPWLDRGWSLTHVESGERLSRIHELPMLASISKRDALEAGREALRLIIAQHTVAVVATKLFQATPPKPRKPQAEFAAA